MIITGIIIVAAAVILMVLSIIGAAISTAFDKEGGAFIGIAIYILMILAYIVGLAVTAIGIVLELT